ncbi:GntR family transcriptional regulator [Thiospirochaeta perfilievii]|uniref:GntR family transcriptional regulator n=1 Tax=Thiospirochaeta perfilievii TaxID=252967 RepID=A0A5C1QB72_9SPIO|nr:GntR family transcriptional regulator [Thiospirochaeta perfilievii]QEN04618.1 GntR family transcriptional regulator [Thiospirochaeta perfilievii]
MMVFTNDTPIYLQIVNKIKEQLIIGEFKVGEKMPSVREYSKLIKVNPTTIQRVYKELEMEGLIHTKRGMGSFITDDNKLILKMKTEIANKLTDDYIMKMSLIGFDNVKLQKIINKHIREVNNDKSY